MLKPLISYLLILVSSLGFSQVSNKVDLLGQWDDNSLAVSSGLSYNDIWGYTDCEGREYGIIGSVSYTHFVDLTNPATPSEITRIAAPSSLWRDFKTYGHYAYGISENGSGGLQIFDLSQIHDNIVTRVFNSTTYFTNCHNIFIDDLNGRLYAVGTSVANIVALDLTANPANPTLLKNITLPYGYIHDIYIQDHVAYASHIYGSLLAVYNLEDVHSVPLLGVLSGYSGAGLNHSSWVSNNGKVMVMADENHGASLKVVDVADLSDMSVVSTFKSSLLGASNSIAHNPFIIGNQYAIISYYHEGVQIYDISNPLNPVKAGYYDTNASNRNYNGYKGSWGVFPFFPSGNIIASDINNGLFILKPTFDLGYCQDNITSCKRVLTATKKEIRAGESITLQAGFSAEAGSIFTAQIDACYATNLPAVVAEETELSEPEGIVGTNGFLSNDLTINTLSSASILVYPNPFQQEFKILLPANSNIFSNSIQLINNLGQSIPSRKTTCGENCWSIETTNLSSGVYTILLKEHTNKMLTKKVVKF